MQEWLLQSLGARAGAAVTQRPLAAAKERADMKLGRNIWRLNSSIGNTEVG
jgi:hypothetical protein